MQAVKQPLVHEGIEEGHVLGAALERAVDDILDHGLGGIHVVVEVGEGHLGLDHPELGCVALGVAYLGAEGGAEGVHVAEGHGEVFGVELAGDCEVGGLAEKVLVPHGDPLADDLGQGQGQPQQGAGAGDKVFRGILVKVFEAVQCFLTGLDLIKNNQRILCDPLPARHCQILQNAPHIFCRLEELRILRVPVKVEAHISIGKALAEFLQNPGLADLTCAAQHKRFSALGVFPSLKIP